MKLNEALDTLKKAGFITESYAEDTQDPIAVLRKDITNGAINRFEHANMMNMNKNHGLKNRTSRTLSSLSSLRS